MKRLAILITITGLLSGCVSTLEKLENVGNAPGVTQVENPHTNPDYRPLTWPLPDPEPEKELYANSLWQPGSRAFFRDQRASRVGDILRVQVRINDSATLENETIRTRESEQTVANPTLGGFERILMPNVTPLLSLNGDNETTGTGEIERVENIETDVAAVVTQVLPNGNFVIQGTQEVRVNHEVRELSVKGIVRPEDIDSNNTIQSSQIAEARIVYGGRGNVSDLQAPRWGHQVIDILSPF